MSLDLSTFPTGIFPLCRRSFLPEVVHTDKCFDQHKFQNTERKQSIFVFLINLFISWNCDHYQPELGLRSVPSFDFNRTAQSPKTPQSRRTH